jgi:predicted TIM-barrel fold metal-dependent hydrolase
MEITLSERGIGRRAFLQGASVAALSAAGIVSALPSQAQDAAPNSSGTERPKLTAPHYSCDCHQHIYDTARFPPTGPGSVSNAVVADYRLLQRRLGTTRNVIVTPAPYATDNSVTLDAISLFGANARGVATVHPNITDAELNMLARGGIRGIRFANPTVPNSVTTLDMIEPLSKRVNALGWHVDINMSPDQIVANEDLWARLPTTLVFDHLAHIPQPIGADHPASRVIRKLIDKGRTWVKLLIPSTDYHDGPPNYADATRVAQSYVQAAPERLVWGSNWPHPGEAKKPDDALLFDLLAQWAPSAATRHRILVENPEVLYGFGRSS